MTWQMAAQDVDAVLVGGSGAYSVTDDLPWVRDFVRTLGGLVEHNVPLFGSCFGFQ